MLFNEITLIDFGRPLARRMAARRYCGPYKWMPSEPGRGRGFYMAQAGFEMDRAGSSLRLRLEAAGAPWRYDEGCEFIPVIALLPSGRGYLAGWTMGAGMVGMLDATIWARSDDACDAAKEEARIACEREAEANALWRAQEEMEEEMEEGPIEEPADYAGMVAAFEDRLHPLETRVQAALWVLAYLGAAGWLYAALTLLHDATSGDAPW
jgi:hypothetical protein